MVENKITPPAEDTEKYNPKYEPPEETDRHDEQERDDLEDQSVSFPDQEIDDSTVSHRIENRDLSETPTFINKLESSSKNKDN